MAASAYTIIELEGHIIDSLTLAKVIDKIQESGAEYQMNDFQIGQRKNDFSYAQITIWTKDQVALDALLQELKTYGAKVLENNPVQVKPAPSNGVLPEGHYIRWSPHAEILLEGQWIPVDRQGFDLTIVVNPQTRSAQFKKASEVKQGELVVTGKAGLKILPLLEEQTLDAQKIGSTHG